MSHTVSIRREAIKQGVRKGEIQSFFGKRRKELMRVVIESREREEEVLANKLRNQEQRLQYLKGIVQRLQNQFTSGWLDIIEQLYMSLKYFQGRFQSWIESKLLDRLKLIFKPQFVSSNLQGNVARLVADMISCSSARENISNAYIVQSMICEDIIILLLKRQSYQIEQRLMFALLFGSLCYVSGAVRDKVVVIGGGQFLVLLGREMLFSNGQCEYNWKIYLGCVELFSTQFKGNNNRSYLNIDTTISLMPIVLKVMESTQSQKILKNSLLCLKNLLYQNSMIIHRKMVEHNPNIYGFLFNLFVSKPQIKRVRQRILNIFNILAVNFHTQSVPKLLEYPLFDAINEYITITKTQQFIRVGLDLISNLLLDSNTVYKLINHKIFDSVVLYLTHNNQRVRAESYGCVNTVFKGLGSRDEVNSLVKHYKIISFATLEIQKSSYLSLEALKIIKRYIEINGSSGFNKALHDLQSIYNIFPTLEIILYSVGVHPEVAQLAGEIIDISAECTCDIESSGL